ncbi:unnamed protein product, partial [Closterium sp. NIES-64]
HAKYTHLTTQKPSSDKEASFLITAFYQRELLVYAVTRLDRPFSVFHIDAHMAIHFKNAWMRREHPRTLPSYQRFNATPDQWERAMWPLTPGGAMSADALSLIAAADVIGERTHCHMDGMLRNRVQGIRLSPVPLYTLRLSSLHSPFSPDLTPAPTAITLLPAPIHFAALPRRSQLRMAGLAALDVMQRVRRSWEAMAMAMARAQRGEQQEGREGEERDEEQEEGDEELGVGYKSEGGDRMGRGEQGKLQRPRLQSLVREVEGEGGKGAVEGWRDVFDVVTRWRQIANPTDATFWKHSLLSPERVAVRSTTPIHVYNFETVKYYPVLHRAVALTRATLLENEEAFDADYTRFSVPRSSHGSKIEAARDLQELHAAVGRDFSALTLIRSALHPQQRIPGTEFQVKRTNHSYDFYTETVMDADRWSNFNAEMSAAWQSLCTAVLDARTQTQDPQLYRHRIQHAILRLAFFWFQVMPLTRGSAMGGMVAILGLSMAADMQTTALIPPNMHVDWEALLSTRHEDFAAQVQPWLYAAVQASPWHLPLVHQVLSTPRLVLAALTHSLTFESEVNLN